MSWLQTLSMFSFKDKNPDWKVWLHLIYSAEGKNILRDYEGIDYFEDLKPDEILVYGSTKLHGIQESDRLRIQLLNNWGGVYSDFDMLWLRSMKAFPDCETSVCYYRDHYNMSNIVSEAGGPFLKEIINKQKQVISDDYQAYLTQMFNREYPDPETIINRYPRVKMIPYEWFYPYSIYELEKLYKQDIDLTANAFGVHWFNGHELSQLYLKDYHDCSMTTILNNEGYL